MSVSQKEDQSLALQVVFCFTFPICCSFGNQNASNATAIENWGKISHVWPSVKFRGGMDEMSEWILRV